jgi:hypothetical protein
MIKVMHLYNDFADAKVLRWKCVLEKKMAEKDGNEDEKFDSM